MRSLAFTQAGAANERASNLSAARSAYAKVVALADAPPHHVVQAKESLDVIDRQLRKTTEPAHAASASRPQTRAQLYVATAGSDTNPGTQAQPFASVQRAIDVAATLKSGGKSTEGGIEINVAGGLYRLTKGITIPRSASGAKEAPLVLRGAEGATVRLTGGAVLSGFQPVTDKTVLARLPEVARDKVLVSDLKAQGITQFAPLAYRGFSAGSKPSLELFCKGKPMTPRALA